MAKIVANKEKRRHIADIDRDITIQKFRHNYVEDDNRDFSCEDGTIRKDDLKTGGKVKTTKDKSLYVFDSTFYDDFRHIKRKVQLITPKDIGIIMTETGINRDSVVVEGGSGSGALGCYLASVAKKVYSYDINKENLKIAKGNAEKLHLKNIEFFNRDLGKGIEHEADTIILDVPEPWKVIKAALKSVKTGGFIVTYCPTIIQADQSVKEIEKYDNLLHIKTMELIERRWKIKGKAIRPSSKSIGHTAFLTFVRKIGAR